MLALLATAALALYGAVVIVILGIAVAVIALVWIFGRRLDSH